MSFVSSLFGGGASAPDVSGNTLGAVDYANQAGHNANVNAQFAQGVYQNSLPQQQRLQDLAAQTAAQQFSSAGGANNNANQIWNQYSGLYMPNQAQSLADAYGSQYLSQADQSQLGSILSGTSGMTPQEIQSALSRYAMNSGNAQAAEQQQGYAGLTAQNSAQLQGLRQQGVGDLQNLQNSQLSYLAGAQNRDIQNAQANVAASYDTQGRNLARMYGYNPMQMAGMAGQTTAQQALANVNAANSIGQQYAGLNQQTMQNYGGQIAGLNQSIGQQDYSQASANNAAANQAYLNRYNQGIGLRSGAANFGSTLANTANQTSYIGTNSGNSAVANQNTGYLSGLPYAEYQSSQIPYQLNAGQLGVNAELGAGGLMNQQYNTQGNLQAGQAQGTGEMIGAIAGAVII